MYVCMVRAQFSQFRVSTSVQPIALPSHVLLSDNFFRPSWIGLGARRLKNITVILEWVPVLRLHTALPSGTLFVAVNLAEAQSLHRLLHTQQHLLGEASGLALRTVDGLELNVSRSLRAARTLPAASAMEVVAHASMAANCMRFLNSAMFYRAPELESLMEALHAVPEASRRAFFEGCLRYRRRERQMWADTPLAKLFTVQSEWGELHARALVHRVYVSGKVCFLRAASARAWPFERRASVFASKTDLTQLCCACLSVFLCFCVCVCVSIRLSVCARAQVGGPQAQELHTANGLRALCDITQRQAVARHTPTYARIPRSRL